MSLRILNRDSQFVLAEATRTTNVGSSTLFGDKGDNLFAGTSTLSNTWNICQVRLDLWTLSFDPTPDTDLSQIGNSEYTIG